MNISYRLLLVIYSIVPALLFITLIDIFFFNESIKPFVSVSLMSLFIYTLIFELPHIIASFLSFADTEYLSFYKKKIFIRLPLILIAGFLLAYINLELGLTAIVGFTVYHVVAQQTGIAKMIIGSKHFLHDVWKMLAVANVFILWIYAVEIQPFANLLGLHINTLLITGILLFSIVSIFIYKDIKEDIARKYFFLTTFMFLASNFFFFAGYIFFSLFVVRFVHDITAFVFYIVHDRNRNIDSVKNLIYKFLKPIKIPLIILVPLLSVLISYVIRFETKIYPEIIYGVILFTFSHYYIESFMWKFDSIHRFQLKFTK